MLIIKNTLIFAVAVFLLVPAAAGDTALQTPAQAAPFRVEHTQNTAFVPLYDVFEIRFANDNTCDNPFFDVDIDVIFTSPTGEKISVGRFHYGSSQPARIQAQDRTGGRRQVSYHFQNRNIWKARFAPHRQGLWKFSYIFKNAKGARATGNGAFMCVKGRTPNPGFVRIHPDNPFRFVFDDADDTEDAFPLDACETKDTDGDGIGDNLDAADDGDGKPDDKNKNRNKNPDHEELDYDGDGFDRAKAVPWDAFPFDSKEWSDTDGDGIGDNADTDADTDADNDGYSDKTEIKEGTDPKDKLSFPV